MSNYRITTDSTTDLPESYYEEHDISYITLPTTIDGVTYDDNNKLDIKKFYELLRAGSLPTTSQPSPVTIKEFFEDTIKKYNCDIIHICFSSGLSGTYNSSILAANELSEEYPDRKITVIDSLCASTGEGLLLHYAIKKRDEGTSYDDLVKWIEEHKLNICHDFTVDDLNHLHRGGRVSKATAIIGTLANIKPILHVDNEGHLVAVGKVRGRKKSIMQLVDNMESHIGSYRDKNDVVFMCHGDCIDDAKAAAEEITKRFGITNFVYSYTGVAVASHSGPGTLSLFYMGDER